MQTGQDFFRHLPIHSAGQSLQITQTKMGTASLPQGIININHTCTHGSARESRFVECACYNVSNLFEQSQHLG